MSKQKLEKPQTRHVPTHCRGSADALFRGRARRPRAAGAAGGGGERGEVPGSGVGERRLQQHHRGDSQLASPPSAGRPAPSPEGQGVEGPPDAGCRGRRGSRGSGVPGPAFPRSQPPGDRPGRGAGGGAARPSPEGPVPAAPARGPAPGSAALPPLAASRGSLPAGRPPGRPPPGRQPAAPARLTSDRRALSAPLGGACPLRQGTAEGLLRTNAVRACAAPRPRRLRAPSPEPRAAAAPESRAGGARREPEAAQHLQLSECARAPRRAARGGRRGGCERAGAGPAPLSPEGPALARRRGAHWRPLPAERSPPAASFSSGRLRDL
ncbi:skin secretory protein xP2 [Budorcas taxicolor]|uniref:skin secretory protein xP2 n=1 Tax=Budorcas taxicolor TaxID=37181 RepID=UPI002284DD6A|nr:skin secretory protein xP2 [Budorcas taxicolor]